MKKLLSRTTLTLMALTIAGFAVMPEWAHAGILDGPITTVFNNSVAVVLNLILQLTSSLVYVSGVLLSLSINLTLHVGDFFKDAPALRGVWILIRNLSSIGIIFILLYTSILTIVGVSSTGDIKRIVGKIIMAGLLINFSLFFVNIAIDASNLVSLQFYRAIAPQSTTAYTVGAAFTDGGLSNVFMSSLKIPKIYGDKSFFKGADVFASISIATLGGIIMMITAAISFAAASLAFMYRTAVLLFIMALSPIYFVAMIFPQLEDKSKKLVDIFTTQLIFMPTYLFLMYVALRFVGDPSFSKIFNIGATSGAGAGTPMFIGTMIQYVIALVFINAPLVAAISMGVAGAKSVPSVNSVAGWFGQHSVGRASKKLQGTLTSSGFAARNPNVSVLLNRALGNTAGATFGGSKGGYDKKFKEYSKERSDLAKKVGITDASKKKFVEHGINNWDDKLDDNKLKLRNTNEKFKTARTLAEMKQAEKESRELSAEIAAMEKAGKEDGKIKYLEEKAEKEAKLEFAKNLEDPKDKSFIKKAVTFSWVTSKARKDAADAIRKEINKSKTGKLIDMIKEVSGEDKPAAVSGGSEEAKPKK